MGLPNMKITFHERGITAIERGERGIVALILEDSKYGGPNDISIITDIPKTLLVDNKEQIELALKGYATPPKKVIAYVVPKGTAEAPVDYTEALEYLESVRFDYLAIPEISDADVELIATWIKSLRDKKKKKVKAVLPNCPADHEGIINFAESKIVTKDREFTTKEYCGRIAGLIAGTPLTIACTFAPLPEVISCDNKDRDELSELIEEGKLVLYNDGEKIKIARGVNSLVTVTAGVPGMPSDKGYSHKKIKIIEALDLIHDDISKEAEDSYLGKYSNSYDNKCLLIVAIIEYLDELQDSGILNRDHTAIGIDIEEQTKYLRKEKYTMVDGRGVDEMTELEIKKADTGDQVFLKGQLKVLDAMEEIFLPIDI